jgi:hypothetical protein
MSFTLYLVNDDNTINYNVVVATGVLNADTGMIVFDNQIPVEQWCAVVETLTGKAAEVFVDVSPLFICVFEGGVVIGTNYNTTLRTPPLPYNPAFNNHTFGDIAPVLVTVQSEKLFVSATPSAFVTGLNGNKNYLTITVVELFSDGSATAVSEQFSINKNSAGIYQVSNYTVYVDTKGNTQIVACYIIE